MSKTNEMVKRYDDVIDLSIGDPDYPADKRIIEAMYKAGLQEIPDIQNFWAMKS